MSFSAWIVDMTRREMYSREYEKWGVFSFLDEVKQLGNSYGWDLDRDDIRAITEDRKFFRFKPDGNEPSELDEEDGEVSPEEFDEVFGTFMRLDT